MTSGISDPGPNQPSDVEGANTTGLAGTRASQDSPPSPHTRLPFPWGRLLYAIGFSFIAWIVFWAIVVLLAPLHYITIAITGGANEELQRMNLRAAHYLFELLGFIAGARDEKPFPLGPFPKD